MKETVKASIGGYLFILDTDAYENLNIYLDGLRAFYKSKESGNEIIEDIESRMSELLLLQITSPNQIVTLDDATKIMQIMGNPSDFDEERKETSNTNSHWTTQDTQHPFSKKIYRDKENSVLGGVCSGLGQYFKIDPVLVRIGYIVSIILTNYISDKISGVIFLSYLILWAVVPRAKTITQKIAMTGKNPSVEAIESRSVYNKKMRGTILVQTLGKILKITLSIIFLLVSILFIVAFSLLIFKTGYPNGVPTKEVLQVFGLYNKSTIISLSMLWLIPTFMIFFCAIRLMLKFRPKDFVVLAISFTTWLVVCTYVGVRGTEFGRNYRNKESYTEVLTQNIKSDTIHVELDKRLLRAENALQNDHNFYILNSEIPEFFVSPRINIKKSDTYEKIEVEVRKRAYARNKYDAEDKAKEANIRIEEQGSSLIITPHLYSKDNTWDREIFEITIYAPEDKTIILDHILSKNADWNIPTMQASKEEPINYNDSISIEINS